MANDLKLQEGHPVDENLRPIKVNGQATALEVAKSGIGAKVTGDLEVTGNISGNIKDVVHDLTSIVSTDLTIDDSGDISLDADGGEIYLKDGGTTFGNFSTAGSYSSLTLYEDGGASSSDSFDIKVTTHAATTLSTVDDAAAAAHLTLAPDGDLILDPVSTKIIINATDKLLFDGGTDTYITETSADSLQIMVGGDPLAQLSNYGADGNLFHFRDASAGFSRLEATFSETPTIGSGGTDDTDIDFRFSNKWRLEMTGDITTMNLIFPSAAGNFLLVCTTNGDHDVTNWKVFESDETAATTADVMWAGGSVPAFTSSGVDIVSFYWDATEQQAYGVASLAFATP